MIRYIGSVVSGLLVSLAIFWLAAFLVRDPGEIAAHQPHRIKMYRFLDETAYAFPAGQQATPAWWETTDIWCDCCCMCGGGWVSVEDQPYIRPLAQASLLAPAHRPLRPLPLKVTQQSLLDNHWHAAVIDVRYPRQAQARGLEADVLVEVTLAADGSVTDAIVIGGAPNGQLERAALKAVMAARFDAPVRDGQQVRPMTRRFLIRFRLPASA